MEQFETILKQPRLCSIDFNIKNQNILNASS